MWFLISWIINDAEYFETFICFEKKKSSNQQGSFTIKTINATRKMEKCSQWSALKSLIILILLFKFVFASFILYTWQFIFENSCISCICIEWIIKTGYLGLESCWIAGFQQCIGPGSRSDCVSKVRSESKTLFLSIDIEFRISKQLNFVPCFSFCT